MKTGPKCKYLCNAHRIIDQVHGGINKFCRESKINPSTLYNWFKNYRQMSIGQMQEFEALGINMEDFIPFVRRKDD